MAPSARFRRAHSRGMNCGGDTERQVVYYSPLCTAPWTRPSAQSEDRVGY